MADQHAAQRGCRRSRLKGSPEGRIQKAANDIPKAQGKVLKSGNQT